jgi:hypothetical protein
MLRRITKYLIIMVSFARWTLTGTTEGHQAPHQDGLESTQARSG